MRSAPSHSREAAITPCVRCCDPTHPFRLPRVVPRYLGPPDNGSVTSVAPVTSKTWSAASSEPPERASIRLAAATARPELSPEVVLARLPGLAKRPRVHVSMIFIDAVRRRDL